jgi:hypothetical protein
MTIDVAIRDELQRVASVGGMVYYSELALIANLNVDSEYFGAFIGQKLDEINRLEHEQGRPLLSAVVVTKEHNIPGVGFFTCARELGLHGGNDRDVFWIS